VTVSLLLASAVWAQSDSGKQASDSGQLASEDAQQTPAAPAFGREPTQPQASEFPPLSGLDEASLEPNVAPRSFVVSTFQASEVVDSNATSGLNNPGRNAFVGSTFLDGLIGLQRLWHRYRLLMDYRGGGALYTGQAYSNTQMHTIDLDWRILWRNGVVHLRDAASYLPQGSFGAGGYGGLAGIGGLGTGVTGGGIGIPGQLNLFGYGTYGSLGIESELNNLSVVDVEQSLSPRSTVTLAAGYNLVHFTHNTSGLLLNSRQVTAQAGYNYALSRRNMLTAVYGFQNVHFPTVNGAFNTHMVQLLFGHQISERMELILGGGPQITEIKAPGLETSSSVSISARASLRYRFPNTTISMTYDRFNSPGSGFYAGARTDVVHLTVARPVRRQWQAVGDVGYTHNRHLLLGLGAINANSYNYSYAGARVTRIFTRSLNSFLFYQYTHLNFGSGFCATAGGCSHLSSRHLVGIGLTWQPHAIRLD
jgi:hypothetical protein